MLLALLLAACAPGPDATDNPLDDQPEDRTVAMAGPAKGYQAVTEPYEVPPYTEVELCSVVRLAPGDGQPLAWVNRFESLVSEGSHHMNVLIGEFSFLDAFLGDGASEGAFGATVGQYDCDDLNLMEQAYTVFPSQRSSQQIVLPEGVAVPMPLPLLAVFSHHYVNAGPRPLRINAVLNLEVIDADDVEQVAQLVFDDIGTINVPANTRQTIQRTCVFDHDATVALVSTHTHARTECATLQTYTGSTGVVDPEPFFVNKRWDQPPVLHFEPGTRAVRAGDGVQWSCHVRNDTSATLVNDGTAEGEMCVFAAVTYPSPWTAEEVAQVMADGDLVGLATLMGSSIGPCASTLDDVGGPSTSEAVPLDASSPACADEPQTESNVLE